MIKFGLEYFNKYDVKSVSIRPVNLDKLGITLEASTPKLYTVRVTFHDYQRAPISRLAYSLLEAEEIAKTLI